MSQSTVASYPQMVQQLSLKSSDKAHVIQVIVILSLWHKHRSTAALPALALGPGRPRAAPCTACTRAGSGPSRLPPSRSSPSAARSPCSRQRPPPSVRQRGRGLPSRRYAHQVLARCSVRTALCRAENRRWRGIAGGGPRLSPALGDAHAAETRVLGSLCGWRRRAWSVVRIARPSPFALAPAGVGRMRRVQWGAVVVQPERGEVVLRRSSRVGMRRA